jgi:diaminopimelate decarboxylase
MLGLHVHLGSQVMDDAPARMLVEWLGGWCAELRAELEWTPEILNLGGGLGIRYTLDDARPPSPEEYARALVERVQHAWTAVDLRRPQLVFEPGRSLVGRAALTLYRVGVVKRSGQTTWVAIDGGMSDNPRFSALVANRAAESPDATYAVCGKHCESGDVLIERVALAAPARGDLLAVPATGAYTLAMASDYNAVPRPAAVLAKRMSSVLIETRRC